MMTIPDDPTDDDRHIENQRGIDSEGEQEDLEARNNDAFDLEKGDDEPLARIKEKPPKSGRKLALLGIALGLMGIGLGGYNSLQSSLTKPLDLSGYDRQMDELRAKNKNLQAQISRLERHNKTQSSLNISDISSRIEALETRPVVSENTGDISDLISELARLENRVDTLSAFTPDKGREAQADGEDQNENIDAGGSGRLISVPAEIANRLESLESQINRADPEVFLFGESLLQDQLEALRQGQNSISARQRYSVSTDRGGAMRGDVRTILPTFPETALRARLRELDVADKSWWRRSLSRHISVKKPGETDRVDDIQTHIANGDIDKALGVIENLPSQARSVVRDWVNAAQSIDIIEGTEAPFAKEN